MKTSQALRVWTRILAGRVPSLSIEITKECPLRCPGCYAFDTSHLGPGQQLRQLSDLKGDELVRRILALVDRYKPMHLSLVGGDPLVRYRELDALVPQLATRDLYTQIVTSAFRTIPAEWSRYKRLHVAVSVDGLPAEHDVRRKPATYENVQALVALSHHFGKAMVARGKGGIINVASNASFQPLPFMATYAATKAFVLHFSEAIHGELAGKGVHVMATCPGPTATSFFDGTLTNMASKNMDSSESVVRRTLKAFDQKRAVAYPGRMSVRLASWLPRLLPRALVVRIAAIETVKMGLHD